VTLVDLVRDATGEPISSTRIRNALSAGEVESANALLGRPWRVSGEVVNGRQLGRTLGYPTANMELAVGTALRHGIYAVRVVRADGTRRDGVASFGRRPTFDNGEPLLETFVFDFSGNLYGETIGVELHSFLRGEEKFDSADALVAQMDRDADEARRRLAMIAA
jgi:riboflavin kinase/FMN adenylyltransferase